MADVNNYVLGRGELLFDRFADGSKVGTGKFKYFGNTPDFNLSQSEETLDHFDADHGVKVKDESVTLSQDTSGNITCDNISDVNLALWWLGDEASQVIASASGQSDTFALVQKGDRLVLGQTDALPMGPGSVTITNVVSGSDTISASGNWEADLERGVVTILPDAVHADFVPGGAPVTVNFTIAGHTLKQVISKGRSIYGALMFNSTNPVGRKRDAIFPYVKLAPNGDYSLKGDDWQNMSFALDILKLSTSVDRAYWTTRA